MTLKGANAMRVLWKGAVSFGLVNIPVSMYVATENKDIKFNYLHRECMSPIKYKKFCSRCEKEVSGDDIVRGYEYQKGNYVIINPEDFERIPQENTKTVDILDFVSLSQVDPVYFDKTYYFEAGNRIVNGELETENFLFDYPASSHMKILRHITLNKC